MAHLRCWQRLGGIGFLVFSSLLVGSVTQIAAQPVPCHLYTSSSAPSPFTANRGVPWNVFNPSELFLKALCTNTITTAQIGPATYVYHQGYAWTGSAWQLIDLTCTGGALVSDIWCPNSAAATVPNTATYYAAYTCNWMNNRWYCGCRDQQCTQPMWQIQRVLGLQGNVSSQQYLRQNQPT